MEHFPQGEQTRDESYRSQRPTAAMLRCMRSEYSLYALTPISARLACDVTQHNYLSANQRSLSLRRHVHNYLSANQRSLSHLPEPHYVMFDDVYQCLCDLICKCHSCTAIIHPCLIWGLRALMLFRSFIFVTLYQHFLFAALHGQLLLNLLLFVPGRLHSCSCRPITEQVIHR